MNVAQDRNSEPELPVSPATRRSRDEDWHERARWTPSAEEFQRYLEREVEMARLNLERGNPPSSTLDSSATIMRAQEEPNHGKDGPRP
jgi:hypothetical protein